MKIRLAGKWSDHHAEVDADLYEELSKYRWYGLKSKGSRTIYARTTVKQQTIYMHRLVLPGAKEIDHIDGNGLNNQRKNLQSVSRSENLRRAHKRKPFSSRS